MNIVGVGIDIEKVARFRKLPYEKNMNFYDKIFTTREIKYCLSYKDPYPRFTVRFAAKEAAIKALNGVAKPPYSEIEIQKDKKNKPKIYIDRDRFRKTACLHVALSLAHSDSYAVAFAVVTDNRHEVREKAEMIVKKGSSYAMGKIC